MTYQLEGQVALVTGSSKGLGKAIAFELAASGAKVALNYYNNIDCAQATLNELKATGAEAILVRADVSNEDDVNELNRHVQDQLGMIDIAVINATPDQPQRAIEDYSWDDYMTMINFFVKSPYLIARAILPEMKAKRYGRIINICSEVYGASCGNFSAYVAAKGGQQGWTRSMASELAPWNITVNAVSPGWIPVERHQSDSQQIKDEYLETVPLGRWGVPGDIASAVAFLASKEAGFITGENINVNGGRVHF